MDKGAAGGYTAAGQKYSGQCGSGSGKTAVLVERILSKITDKEHPVDIDRLLIMTFTRAAAGEMKERNLGSY